MNKKEKSGCQLFGYCKEGNEKHFINQNAEDKRYVYTVYCKYKKKTNFADVFNYFVELIDIRM